MRSAPQLSEESWGTLRIGVGSLVVLHHSTDIRIAREEAEHIAGQLLYHCHTGVIGLSADVGRHHYLRHSQEPWAWHIPILKDVEPRRG